MDKEHARFILRSFRPDGADAADRAFEEALALATRDRELGEWLASERAQDAEFSAAVHAIPLPENLRHEILDALAWHRGELHHGESPEDEVWIRALASIQPPAGLRAEILTAMRATAAPRKNIVPMWKKAGIPAAAAAAVALAIAYPSALFNSGRDHTIASDAQTPGARRMPVELVRAGFINLYKSPDFALEHGRGSHEEIMARLAERGLPCPTCMPPGLLGIEGVGCREIIIDGHRGAVVCYRNDEHGMVHLVIFRAEDIQDPLPFRKHVRFAQDGEWAAAAWRNDENAFVLLGNTEVERIASLF